MKHTCTYNHQSQFIEMFGNPFDKCSGKVPLSSLCIINPSRPKDLDDSLPVSFIPMEKISEEGEYSTFTIRPLGEVKKGFTYCADEDVLFAKITPCMENGKGAMLKELSNGIGYGSTEFHVLRPLPGITTSTWLYSLTKLDILRKDAAKNMTGTGGQKRVPASYLENFSVLPPSIDLQDEFSSIVRQADKSKFGGFKSQFIEMFDSVESFSALENIVSDTFPGEWGNEPTSSNAIKVIRTTNFTNEGRLDLSEIVTREIDSKKVSRKKLKKGDTILERSGGTKDNPVGRVVFFDEDGDYLFNNFTQVLRPKENVNPVYLFYSLYNSYNLNKAAMRAMASQTTGIQNLSMSDYMVKQIKLPSKKLQDKFESIYRQADKSKYYVENKLNYICHILTNQIQLRRCS